MVAPLFSSTILTKQGGCQLAATPSIQGLATILRKTHPDHGGFVHQNDASCPNRVPCLLALAMQKAYVVNLLLVP